MRSLVEGRMIRLFAAIALLATLLAGCDGRAKPRIRRSPDASPDELVAATPSVPTPPPAAPAEAAPPRAEPASEPVASQETSEDTSSESDPPANVVAQPSPTTPVLENPTAAPSTTNEKPAVAVARVDLPIDDGPFFPEIESAMTSRDSAFSIPNAPSRKPTEDFRPLPPDEDEITKARTMLKQVFKNEIELSRKGDGKRFKNPFAHMLMESRAKVEGDPAALYVLLDTVYNYALETGDFTLSLQAATELANRYKVSEFELRKKAVVTASKEIVPYFVSQDPELRAEAQRMFKEAITADDFVTAREVLDVFTESCRRSGGRAGTLIAQTGQKELEDRRKAYQAVPDALKTLEQTPDDSAAAYTVGAYLCLVKFQWKEGIPLLAHGSNLRLKVLANEELAPSHTGDAMAELGDEYWALAEHEVGLRKRGLVMRALYWYRQALPSMANNLAKVQTERRVDEVRRTYGEAMVDEIMKIMNTTEVQPAAAVANDTGG